MKFENRFAIVVGSNKYKEKNKLQFSIKDAEDIKDVLIDKCGLKEENVELLKYQSPNDLDLIENVFGAFGNIIDKGFIKNKDTVIFYFSGHGYYSEEKNNSFIELSADVSLSVSDVLSNLKLLQAKNTYVIIDACQSGMPFNLKAKNKQDRRLRFHAKGFYCIYGASKNAYAYEPEESISEKNDIKNGYLTHYFKEAIYNTNNYKDGYLSLKSIDDYLTYQTEKKSKFSQIPASNIYTEGYHPFAYNNIEELRKNEVNVKKKSATKDFSKTI